MPLHWLTSLFALALCWTGHNGFAPHWTENWVGKHAWIWRSMTTLTATGTWLFGLPYYMFNGPAWTIATLHFWYLARVIDNTGALCCGLCCLDICVAVVVVVWTDCFALF